MYPTMGQPLNFDPKIAEQWEKAYQIMENIQWDYNKLTAENKRFFKQINYDYENDSQSGY
jgi:hypothetical protein